MSLQGLSCYYGPGNCHVLQEQPKGKAKRREGTGRGGKKKKFTGSTHLLSEGATYREMQDVLSILNRGKHNLAENKITDSDVRSGF